jgi:hypothetical protein
MKYNKCIEYYIYNFVPIKKNGTIIKHLNYLEKNLNALSCFLKNENYFCESSYRYQKKIIDDKKIKSYVKLFDLLPRNLYFIKIQLNKINKNNYHYFYYNKKNTEKLTKYIYIRIYIDKNKNKLSIIEKLALLYYQIKLKYKHVNKKNIFIELFYAYYIKYIKNEILEKYNINITLNFNYRELYIFLNKHGYVKNYYQIIVKDVEKKYLELTKKKDFFDEIPNKYSIIYNVLKNNKLKIKEIKKQNKK